MNEINELKNSIEIPYELDFAIKAGIERGRKEKNKIAKSKKNKIFKKLGIAVACITILTTVVGITKPDLVQAIPIIGSIFKDFQYDSMGNKLKNFEDFSTSVNKTIDKNGIKVTINDIAIDDNVIAITMTIKGDNIARFVNKGIMGAPELNGKNIGSYDDIYIKIDDNTMETIIYGNVSEMDLGENIDIELDTIYIGDVKGPWNFKFKTTKNGTSKYSKTINVNKKISLRGEFASEFEIEKLVMSPFGNTINFSGTYYEENKDMRKGINSVNRYKAIDENGKVLNISITDEGGNKEGYSGKAEIFNDLSKTKYIIVTPILKETGARTESFNGEDCPIYQCSANPQEINNTSQKLVKKSRETTENEKKKGYAYDTVDHVYRMYNENFVTLDELVNTEIQVNKETKVIIKSIEANEEKTKITVKVEGNYTEANIDSIVLFNEDYADTSREEDGELSKVEDAENNILSIELKPVDITKNYKIALPIIKDPVIEDKYSIKIPLE